MKRRQRRLELHISTQRAVLCACPNCSTRLDAVTHVSEDKGMPDLKGHATMCAECGAMLIFEDNAGRVRMMTEAERNTHQGGELEKILRAYWEKRRPNFTQRSN